jgi:GNAT superfamily N-acetyltransferase
MTSFRKADASEIDPLVNLINTAYLVEQFFKDGPRVDRGRVVALMTRGTFLVADEPSGPAGCVYVEVRPNRRGYFGLLAVDPRCQGTGLGRRLVQAAEALCREAGCLAIDLRIVNLREELPAFYRRLGYRELGTEPYEDGATKLPCHFIVMTRDLTA